MRVAIRLIILWLVSSSVLLNLVLWVLLRSHSTKPPDPHGSSSSSSSAAAAAGGSSSSNGRKDSSQASDQNLKARIIYDVPWKKDSTTNVLSLQATLIPNSRLLSNSTTSSSITNVSLPSSTPSQLSQRLQLLAEAGYQHTKPLDMKYYVGPGQVDAISPSFFLPEGVVLRTFRWNFSETVLSANGLCESLDFGFQEVPRIPEAVNDDWWRRSEPTLLGGVWTPEDCQPRDQVAILVPYRNREGNLKIFLAYMHFFLQQQGIDYGIYVIEQNDTHKFNRGKLFNIGFQLTQLMHNYTCYMLHDIDKLPEDTRHSYTCQDKPVHMPSQLRQSLVKTLEDLKKVNNTMPYHDGEVYKGFFGGVSALRTEHYKVINGMVNTYWGWGGEDDDLFGRCKAKKLLPKYPKGPHGKYLILYHNPDAEYSHRPMPKFHLVRRRMPQNGISTLKFELVDIVYKPLYTHIIVRL